jgi:hypothetical protein
MTRRWFIRGVVGVVTAIGTGVCRLGEKASPRQIWRAVKLGRYPGRVAPMGDVDKQAKWSG